MSMTTYHGEPVEFLGISVKDTGSPYSDGKRGPKGRGYPGYGDIRLPDGTVRTIRLDQIQVRCDVGNRKGHQ